MKKIKEAFKKFIEKSKEQIDFSKRLILSSIVYGLVINYSLWGLFGTEFIIYKVPAYGLAFYLIKDEIAKIIIRIVSSFKPVTVNMK